MSFFTADNISAGYGGKNVIENISFVVEKGELAGVLGANGSGKTTLLKAMCGILAHKGNCTLKHTPLEKLSAKKLADLISYIPQRSGISIDISALEVVLMGYNPRLGLLEHPDALMKQRAIDALRQVGLAGLERKNYLHLSEGQKQLCILARTLVADSSFLMLDEPESALDFSFRYKMLSLIKEWVSEEERGAIVSLHDPSLALNFCDKLLLLSDNGLLAVIEPKKDSLADMEELLSALYGNISLQRCLNKKGTSYIVMLRED